MQSEIVTISARVQKNDSRTEKIEGNVAALQKTIEDLAKQVLELQSNQTHQKEKNAAIEKSIAISDATPQARDGKSETKRDPDQYDKKVVCISAKNPIAKDPLWEILASKSLPNAGIDPAVVDLKGPPLGRNFRLQFKGEGETPNLRARKFLSSFNSNGEWKNLTIEDRKSVV